MKKKILSERSIYQTEREAEDGVHKRNPLNSHDVPVRNGENNKPLKHYNLNGCRPRLDIVDVVEQELLAYQQNPCQKKKGKEKPRGHRRRIIDG